MRLAAYKHFKHFATILLFVVVAAAAIKDTSSRPVRNFTSLRSFVTVKKATPEPFEVFCHEGVPKSIFQIWRSVHLQLAIEPNSYELYHGVNHTDVYANYESSSRWKRYIFFGSSDTSIELPAFSPYCVGVETKETYAIRLEVRVVNYWKALQTLVGLCLYLSAPTLSRHPFFHYAVGIALGVSASVIILLYCVSRLIPRKSVSYLVLGFGSSFFLYIVKMLWYNLYETVASYSDFIVAYCVVSAFLSFMVCYRLGPVKNSRTQNLIQWSLQALSFLLIFFSSEYRELSTSVVLVLVAAKSVPIRWIKWITSVWHKRFPPKIRLLTEIEFIEQGERETKKALEDLREYCNSPDCDVWKIVKKLKDPVRFASFIETGSQYTDQELLEYNSDDLSYEFCDDQLESHSIGHKVD